MNLFNSASILAQQLGQMTSRDSARADLEGIVPIIIPALCILLGWLAWVMTRTRHLKVKAQIEIQNRLLEKIHSSEYIVQLLQSEEGRQFLEAISNNRPASTEEIMSSIQKGVIFTMVGLASLFLRWIFPMGYGVFIVAGILIGGVGVGLLICSAIAYRLSKAWGLLSTSERVKPPDQMMDQGLFR